MTDMPMLLLALALSADPQKPPSPPPDPLTVARELYNQEQYDAAIETASAIPRDLPSGDAAALVLARAHLERYRRSTQPADLDAAREALRTIDPSKLPGRDQVEFTVGLGEWLFLDDHFGAAAEIFDGAVDQSRILGVEARDRILDWWATALDRHAQVSPGYRAHTYRRVADRMETELRANPGSTAAGYWLPAASRALGDVDRAWHTAVAGWLRSREATDRGAALRADLDRLVQTAVIPERARELAGPGRDTKAAADAMLAEWNRLKQQWN
jgi:hypothetical protein